TLEILNIAFVLFRRRATLESSEIAPLAGLGIFLAGIEPVFAGRQFADHASSQSLPLRTTHRPLRSCYPARSVAGSGPMTKPEDSKPEDTKPEDTKPEDCGIVSTALPSREDARGIARILLAEKLAACVQLLDMESHYVWQGATMAEPEVMLLT